MPPYQASFYPEVVMKEPEEDWVKYLYQKTMEELMKEEAEEDRSEKSPAWSLVIKSTTRIESVTELIIEPVIESVTEPMIESVTEPVIESVTEPMIESVTLVIESVTFESVDETTSEFVLMQSESAVVGPFVDVTLDLVNEMKEDSDYSSVPNDHECIDPSEDLPTELKHLIEKAPAYEIIE